MDPTEAQLDAMYREEEQWMEEWERRDTELEHLIDQMRLNNLIWHTVHGSPDETL